MDMKQHAFQGTFASTMDSPYPEEDLVRMIYRKPLTFPDMIIIFIVLCQLFAA